MVTIEVIVRDEQEVISQQTAELNIEGGRFENIERGVEKWKQQILPEIEAVLLKKKGMG